MEAINNKVRILFIVKRPGIGGVQTFVKIMHDYLKQRGIFSLIYFHYPDYMESLPTFSNYKTATLTRNRFPLLVINFLNRVFSIFKGLSIKEKLTKMHLNKVIRRNNINIIHLNTDTCDYLLPYFKQEKLKVVITLHGIYKRLYFPEKRAKPGLMEFEIKRLNEVYSLADIFTYFSEDNIVPFEIALKDRLDKTKFIKLLNPAFSHSHSSKILNPDILKIGLFGRGFEDKGWKEAYEAFKNIRNLGHKIELHFFGEGDFLNDFVNQIAPSESFYFHGVSSKVKEDMQNLHVGLVPSYHEEMPYIIIEFLSVNIPVLASDTGEIAEMLKINDKETAGWLIPMKNGKPSVSFMEEVLVDLIKNRDHLQDYTERTKTAFRKFDIETTGPSYLNIYESLLKDDFKN